MLGFGFSIPTLAMQRRKFPFSPMSLFTEDPAPDGALWRGTLGAGVFTTHDGATVATPGSAVGRVEDQSGNSRNLAQSSTSLRPTAGRRPVTGIRNGFSVSEGPITGYPVRDGVSQASVSLPGFANSTTFGDNSAIRFLYSTPNLLDGENYTISAFVEMDDGLAPVPSASTVSGDFSLNISGITTNTGVSYVSHVSGSLYRVWGWGVAQNNNSTFSGPIKYTGQNGRGFRMSGVQIELGTTPSVYQKAVSTFDVTETGIESVSQVIFDLVDDVLTSPVIAGGLSGQVFVAGEGGCYVTDLAIAAAGTFSIGGTGHNWTAAAPGILRAVTGNTGRLLDAVIREGDFTEGEISRLERFYRAKGGKGLLVPEAQLLTLATMTGGTGWAYGASIWTKSSGTASLLSQAVVPGAGAYLFSVVATRSAGNLTPRFTGGSTVSATTISATGTHTGVLIATTGNTMFELSADSAFAGTVTAVSLQHLIPREEI